LGLKLAERLGFGFVDSDRYLAARHGAEVADIVFKEGWEAFRRYESQALREICGRSRTVVATGGGMVLAEGNRALMKENGLVLYLSAPAEVLGARLAADPQNAQRPSLTGKSVLDEVSEVLREREPLYREAAGHIIEAGGELGEVLERCLAVIPAGFTNS